MDSGINRPTSFVEPRSYGVVRTPARNVYSAFFTSVVFLTISATFPKKEENKTPDD